MKKRLLAAVAALVVLCMGTTVFAASSASTSTTAVTEGVVVKAPTAASVEAAKEVCAEESYELVDVFDLTADTLEKEADGYYHVTLSVPGVSADDSVVVLHYVNGAWETLSALAGNGTVSFQTSSMSPFAVAIVEDASDDADDSADADDSEDVDAGEEDAEEDADTTSPKTGALPIAGMAALVSLAGAAVCSKKARA